MRNGHEVTIRGLDREALSKLAADGKTRYEMDSEVNKYFK
jgi:murein DD-endopeptidase